MRIPIFIDWSIWTGPKAGDTSDQLEPVLQESTGRYLIQSLLPDGWTQSEAEEPFGWSLPG